MNGFRKEDVDATEALSSDSLTGPLASLPSSTGLKGLIGVVGLLTDVLLCAIAELALENDEYGEDPEKHSSCSIHI